MENPAAFTGFDIAVAVIMLLFALFALTTGFLRMVMMLGAWIGSVLLANAFFDDVQPAAREAIGIPIVADFATFIGLFVASLIILLILTKLVSSAVQDSGLGFLDRSLGLVFGVILGAAVISTGFVVWQWMARPESEPDWLAQARTRPLLGKGAELLRALVPADTRYDLENQAGEAGDSAQDAWNTGKQLDRMMNPPPAPEDGQ